MLLLLWLSAEEVDLKKRATAPQLILKRSGPVNQNSPSGEHIPAVIQGESPDIPRTSVTTPDPRQTEVYSQSHLAYSLAVSLAILVILVILIQVLTAALVVTFYAFLILAQQAGTIVLYLLLTWWNKLLGQAY